MSNNGGAHIEGVRSVAQRPRTAEGRAGGGCGRGSPPPARGSVGVTPGKFLGFYIALDDIWWIIINQNVVFCAVFDYKTDTI